MFGLNIPSSVLQENPSNLFATNLLAETNEGAHHDSEMRCCWGIFLLGQASLNGTDAGGDRHWVCVAP